LISLINLIKILIKSDLDIFCSFSPGVGGNVHRDTYDVCLLNVHGKIIYTVNDEIIHLENGDLLRIFAGEPHQSIGITPRITLSYGFGF
jgi:quercetin dioxygenase-like cupin family protein